MQELRRTKVVHVTFDMGIGGAEQVIRNLVEHTDHRRYDVSVLCIEQTIGPFGRELRNKGYRVDSLGRKQGFDAGLVRDLHRCILAKKADILHCHQYTPFIYGLFASFFTPARIVFTEHGRFHPDQRKLKRILLNPLLSCFTKEIVAISRATADALVHYENFPRRKIRLIYNGLNNSRDIKKKPEEIKAAFGIPASAKVLGTVARLDPIKNQALMLKALKQVRCIHPEAHLIIVGDGPERQRLENLAAELDLRARVTFTGFRQDAYLFYSLMDVFLLTSFSEGTAMTLLEAMAQAVPCIATRVGGNVEIVLDRRTGLLVPDNDEQALAMSISTLLSDDQLRRAMGNAGLERFKERFTVRRMVDAYQSLYSRWATGA